MEHVTTLGEFIIEKQQDFPGSSGEFSRLLSAIRLASKIVSNQVNKAGLLTHIVGAAGSENIQGEQQQKLDVYANNQFIKALKARKVVCGIASEENDEFIRLNEDGSYIVAMPRDDRCERVKVVDAFDLAVASDDETCFQLANPTVRKTLAAERPL